MGKLYGKVALITGAASGIGRASAILFAQEGAKVVVGDCVSREGRETVRTIKRSGGEAIFVKVDVSRETAVKRMIDQTVETYGRIDILFNNAGVMGESAPTAEATEENWDFVLNTNLKSVFLASKYAIPIMLKQGGGVIINTASVVGFMGSPDMAAYGASKGGVIQLTKAMALEYADKNIRVNCICPGMIETPLISAQGVSTQLDFIPQKRAGRAEDIARAALYLACEDSAYVTASCLIVDGGWSAKMAIPSKVRRDLFGRRQ